MVTRRPGAAAIWVPDRQDIIWIACNPQAGSEMRDMHPMLVISPSAFNARTGLVIGLPMTTAPYNATNPFAIAVGAVGTGVTSAAIAAVTPAANRKAGKTSYVLCHQPKSFDWRARRAKPHPLKRLDDTLFLLACGVLNQTVAIA